MAKPWGKDVDDAYRALVETLLASGHRCSIATHDPQMLDQLHAFVERRGPDRDPIEFEMLRGVTPDRLALMRTRGYRTRVYLPYGREWYLYLCHRLAEWPPNIYQAIADAVAGSRRGSAG